MDKLRASATALLFPSLFLSLPVHFHFHLRTIDRRRDAASARVKWRG